MTSISATTIYIKGSAGNKVATYRYTMNGYEHMMGRGYHYSSSVTFEDSVIGQSYYAEIYFKTANVNGADTDSYQTITITM